MYEPELQVCAFAECPDASSWRPSSTRPPARSPQAFGWLAGVRIAQPGSEHRSESVSSGTEQSHCFPSMTGFGLQIAQVEVVWPKSVRYAMSAAWSH